MHVAHNRNPIHFFIALPLSPLLEGPVRFGELIEDVPALRLRIPTALSFGLPRHVVDPAQEKPGILARANRFIYVSILHWMARSLADRAQCQPSAVRHGQTQAQFAMPTGRRRNIMDVHVAAGMAYAGGGQQRRKEQKKSALGRQYSNLSPNCICRFGPAVLVTWPKVPVPMVAPGGLNAGVLVELYISQRN